MAAHAVSRIDMQNEKKPSQVADRPIRPGEPKDANRAPRRAIVAFYASIKQGSEYRAGAEFIRFAAESGFDVAVIADLEMNSKPHDLASHGLDVWTVPSPVVRQPLLYRFTDFIPQFIWHYRVARHLRVRGVRLEQLWIQNGAQPWLPLAPYRHVTRNIIWGPIGGGALPNDATMSRLDRKTRFRERLRSGVEGWFMRRKRALLASSGFPHLSAIARTHEAQDGLRLMMPASAAHSPVIPEILAPIAAQSHARVPTDAPRFVWVGQDIPRKNLPAALELFSKLRASAFPGATLDVFGVAQPPESRPPPGVMFRGWVRSIDWTSYRNDGVLLLTSYREGLPSVVLEAASAGLLCAVADVGSLCSLNINSIHLLNHDEYPSYSESTIRKLVGHIRSHLMADHIEVGQVNFRTQLKAFLSKRGIR